MQFAQHLDLVPTPCAVARGGPFAHAVHGEKCRLGIRRRKKCRGRMRLVMFREKDFARETRQLLLNQRLHPDALANPERNRHQESFQPTWRVSQIAMEDAIKFDERLLVKGHTVHLRQRNAALPQAILDRVSGERRVVLFAREPFLLCRSDDLAIAHQARGAIMIKR